MSKVIVFGGTTEGRQLAELLADKGIYSIYCVATEYGSEPIKESEYITVHSGRMTSDDMRGLYEKEQPDAIVNAIHPFAVVGKTEIENSLFKYKPVPFFRLAREDEKLDDSSCTYFDSVEECEKALKETSGKILLTTGSKNLADFCKDEEIRNRIVARIIPNEESFDICHKNGLKGEQIIAMQGPFSTRMNIAFIKEIDARTIVLKESGKASGAASRIEAANACGIKAFVIRRPAESMEAMDFDSVKKAIFELFDIKEKSDIDLITPDKKISVVLAGYGMGFGSLTTEVLEEIKKADYIFGAPRLIVTVDSNAKKYPYYLSKDIIPCLKELASHISTGIKKAVVLFSGDTGFYSGTKKLYQALGQLQFCKTTLMPGISSISALSSKSAISYENSAILSAHGVKENVWKPLFIEAVKYNQKTFMLTTGSRDVRVVGELLRDFEERFKIKFRVFVGTNLYANETAGWISTSKCAGYDVDGLSTMLIVNDNPLLKPVAPGLKDDEFIRDKVPMSKEEIRSLSICKLRLKKGAVVYDIGSGSGSVAVEMALLDSSINVYAIEIKEEACGLIKKNIDNFVLDNVSLVKGAAPEAMHNLPSPTHVFIGGSGGRLSDIIKYLTGLNTPIRVVINSVTLETISEINTVLKEYSIKDVDTVQVSVSKAKQVGDYNVMQGQNPVYIVSFNL